MIVNMGTEGLLFIEGLISTEVLLSTEDLLSTEESEGPWWSDTDTSSYSLEAPGSKKDPSCQPGQRALMF